MGELFPGPGVRITHDVIQTPTRSYRVEDLSLVHINHENVIDVVMASSMVRVCSGTMTGFAAMVAATGSQLMHSPQVTVAGTLVALASAVTAVRGSWLARRPRALWAYHHGERVCLFVSRDRMLIGQVERALVRAFESVP